VAAYEKIFRNFPFDSSIPGIDCKQGLSKVPTDAMENLFLYVSPPTSESLSFSSSDRRNSLMVPVCVENNVSLAVCCLHAQEERSNGLTRCSYTVRSCPRMPLRRHFCGALAHFPMYCASAKTIRNHGHKTLPFFCETIRKAHRNKPRAHKRYYLFIARCRQKQTRWRFVQIDGDSGRTTQNGDFNGRNTFARSKTWRTLGR
jgi:hypothetical protein